MKWDKEESPIFGPRGIVVKRKDNRVYIGGSNHRLHWLHHILPGARRREIECGKEIAVKLASDEIGHFDIEGHSIGGCIAQIVKTELGAYGITATVRTYGTKRAPAGYETVGMHYRHRGDFVPLLPPWRPPVACSVVGSWKPFWISHHPRTYRALLE